MCNSSGGRSAAAADGGVKLPHVVGAEQTVIDGDEDLPVGRSLSCDSRTSAVANKRPVNARGAVVSGGAPHAVVDAHGRGDVAAGDRRAAGRLREV